MGRKRETREGRVPSFLLRFSRPAPFPPPYFSAPGLFNFRSSVYFKYHIVFQNYYLAFSTFLINLLWLITLQNYTVACGGGYCAPDEYRFRLAFVTDSRLAPSLSRMGFDRVYPVYYEISFERFKFKTDLIINWIYPIKTHSRETWGKSTGLHG